MSYGYQKSDGLSDTSLLVMDSKFLFGSGDGTNGVASSVGNALCVSAVGGG